jgi:hypothetical protein
MMATKELRIKKFLRYRILDPAVEPVVKVMARRSVVEKTKY